MVVGLSNIQKVRKTFRWKIALDNFFLNLKFHLYFKIPFGNEIFFLQKFKLSQLGLRTKMFTNIKEHDEMKTIKIMVFFYIHISRFA